MFELDQNFIIELFKSCIVSKTFLDTVVQYMEYQYFGNDRYLKAIYEKIVQQYDLNGSTTTIGVLSQTFKDEEQCLKIIHKIQNCNILDKQDIILNQFEKFIINTRFVILHTQVAELHNSGQGEKAIDLLAKESVEIANFSIKKNHFTSIFGGFDQRQFNRVLKSKDVSSIKVPYSIPPLDFYSRGGINKGTSACILAKSGAGKSTFLRWVGGSAARLSYKVVHFQAEGTEEECLDAYDALWTSVSLEEIEFGSIPEGLINQIKKTHKDILSKGGDVYIKATEKFDEMSLNDCNDIISDVEKLHGKIDMVIFDYAELFKVNGKYSNSESGERKRRLDIANKMTNIAVSRNLAVLTATQANDVRPDKWNNPEFVLTRSDISEFKGFLKPFSQFITLNQTEAESDAGVIRLFNDKFRKYKSGQTYKIAQSLTNSRFCDKAKTIALFWDDVLNRPRGLTKGEIDKKKK